MILTTAARIERSASPNVLPEDLRLHANAPVFGFCLMESLHWVLLNGIPALFPCLQDSKKAGLVRERTRSASVSTSTPGCRQVKLSINEQRGRNGKRSQVVSINEQRHVQD